MPWTCRKAHYRALCATEKTIPIFARDWWLDALVGAGNWDVVLVEAEGRVLGAMPFVRNRHLGTWWLSQPPLSQTLGPWIRPLAGRESERLEWDVRIMTDLIAQLPRFGHFIQNWHHSRGNWLPFHWQGFHQTVRYTYVLDDLSEEKRLWEGLRGSVRSDIRKAGQRYKLYVRSDLGLDSLLPLLRMTFARQGRRLPYSEGLLHRLDAACAQHNCRRSLVAIDPQGRLHAGEYLVWDEMTAYDLLSGSDPALRHSGATSLCKWESIRFAATVTRSYDFEGSMLEPVERQLRAFGAEQRAYSRVWKTRSPFLKVVLLLLGIL